MKIYEIWTISISGHITRPKLVGLISPRDVDLKINIHIPKLNISD